MLECCEALSPSRRAFLLGGSAMFAWAHMPRIASAAGTRDPRFVVVVLRGALDGLATAAPVGDPRYASLHGQIALSLSGDHPATPLNSFFALHPAMPAFARMFKSGHGAVVHAAATGYRERSHFDGQDVLESGYAGPGHIESGWLNRALGALPSGERISARGLAVGPATPLILRGKVPVLGWAPRLAMAAPDDLANRVMDLYAHRDPALSAALAQGLDTDRLASREGMAGTVAARDRNAIMGMRLTAEGAARLMAADDGPRIAALSFDGWDTHANEGGPTGRLAQLLGGLDAALEAFESGLGARWKDTSIVTITEFGRTARINGTVGTDHGTGTVALLAGGAIKGARVIADWPGLKDGDLYQGRDLKPTVDLRAVLKGLLAEQFDVSPSVLRDAIFPGSEQIKPLTGLVA
jgi:uncharacterized protein (DUF1501 family)